MLIKTRKLLSPKCLIPCLVAATITPFTSVQAMENAAYVMSDSRTQSLQINAQKYQLDNKYRPSQAKERKTKAPEAILVPVPVGGAHPQLANKPFAKEIAKAANAASLDPALVHAVIFVESRYRHTAISNKGAIGLMQVIPDTGARYGIYNLEESSSNLRAGTLYLRDLTRMFNNRLDLALAAYNAGEGTVMKYANNIPPYRETQMYVRAVLAKYNEWRSYTLAAEGLPEAQAEPLAAAKPERLEYLAGTRLSASRPLSAPTY
jgi:soluble lytic murein transglycosylase-like protein